MMPQVRFEADTDKITQQVEGDFVVSTARPRVCMPDAPDYCFRCIDRISATQQVEYGPCILRTCQGGALVDGTIAAGLQLITPVVYITCSADEVDGGLKLVIAEPVL